MRQPLCELRAALHSMVHATPHQIVCLGVYLLSVRNTVPIGLKSEPIDWCLSVR